MRPEASSVPVRSRQVRWLLRIWCDEIEKLGTDLERLAHWVRDVWDLR